MKNIQNLSRSRAQSDQPSFPSRTLSLLPGLRSPSLHVRQAQQASPPPLLSLSHRHLGPTCQASSTTRQRPPSLSLSRTRSAVAASPSRRSALDGGLRPCSRVRQLPAAGAAGHTARACLPGAARRRTQPVRTREASCCCLLVATSC